jgi:hypothetical protein
MLAALVEDDQVSLWHVMPGGDPPIPAASMPNEISYLHVDGTPAEAQEAGWGIDTPVEAPMELPLESPRSEEAPLAEELFERLAASLPEPLPFEVPIDVPTDVPAPDPDLELPLIEPVVNAQRGSGSPSSTGSLPELEPERPAAPRMRAAETLEAMARRLRNGEIVLPQGPSLGSDAAVLAALLTALLEGRD